MTNLKILNFYELISLLLKEYDLTKNINILEIGCGNGELTNYLLKKGKKCIGIDVEFKEGANVKHLLSKSLIKLIDHEGNRRIDINEKNLKYSWPCENKSIDFAFSSSVIEHILNLEEFILENSRILKKGGYCIHYFPSRLAVFEAHTGILFGGIFQNRIYYKFMTKIGFCKKEYKKFSKAFSYMNNKTNYKSKRDLLKLFDKYNLKFMSERNDLIIRFMGPKLTKFLSKFKFICWLFGIFRSKIFVFKKI